MGINATITVAYSAQGALGGSDNVANSMATPTNTNAPRCSGADLQPGSNTIIVPSVGTVSVAFLRPATGSTNAKTVGGMSGWTASPIVIPVVAGGTFVIVSTSPESIEINYA